MVQAKNISAGLLMYSRKTTELRFFLVHPGGPFFEQKDNGWWTIPKGLPEPDEELLDTALREFREETGIEPRPPFSSLGSVKQKGGKWVHAWAFEGEWDAAQGIRCNTFKMQWPPRSGQWRSFPEVDRAGWFSFTDASHKINQAQLPFLAAVVEMYQSN